MSTTTLRSKRDGWWVWAPYLRNREPVRNTTGSLRAGDIFSGYGRLPEPWRSELQEQVTDYVIYSYATPIAWHDIEVGWFFPPVKYSVTTSQHQSLVSTALGFTPGVRPIPPVRQDPAYEVERAAKAMEDAVQAMIEYDSIGLPTSDGPYSWRDMPTY
jgi:hypothetical protein